MKRKRLKTRRGQIGEERKTEETIKWGRKRNRKRPLMMRKEALEDVGLGEGEMKRNRLRTRRGQMTEERKTEVTI